MIIVHSYLTDGFYPWAEFFLETLFYHHPNINVFLSTRNLNDNQIEKLMSYGDNIIVENDMLSIKSLAKKYNINVDKLKRFKKQIETNCVNKNNKIWKLLISGDDRIKSVYDVIKRSPKDSFILHSDIDMYIRQPLDELFKIVQNNEISMRFRLNSKTNRKVLGSLQSFKVCDKSINFMERWIYHIDKIPLEKRPLGYGQTSCYLAYKDLADKIKWGDFPVKFASPHNRDDDVIRSGNTKQGKTKNLAMYRKDFNKIKKGE